MAQITLPFDFENIFVVTLAGSLEIFSFLSIIFVAGLCAYYRMPNQVAMVMFALFGVIFSQYIGGLYLLLVLVAGMVTFIGISKMFK